MSLRIMTDIKKTLRVLASGCHVYYMSSQTEHKFPRGRKCHMFCSLLSHQFLGKCLVLLRCSINVSQMNGIGTWEKGQIQNEPSLYSFL